MNLYEAKTPLLGKGGEFRLILFSSFAANCLARSGRLNLEMRNSGVCPQIFLTPQRNAFIAAAAVQSRMRVGHTPR